MNSLRALKFLSLASGVSSHFFIGSVIGAPTFKPDALRDCNAVLWAIDGLDEPEEDGAGSCTGGGTSRPLRIFSQVCSTEPVLAKSVSITERGKAGNIERTVSTFSGETGRRRAEERE